jgi:hypothetical protein
VKKTEHCIQKLGHNAWLDLPEAERSLINVRDEMAAIMAAGGDNAWLALSETQREDILAAAELQSIHWLGTEASTKLTEKEHREIFNFIWVGCSMHKDLNVFKASCAALENFWADNKLIPPWLSYPSILTPTLTQFRTLLTSIPEPPSPFHPLQFPWKHSCLLHSLPGLSLVTISGYLP